ncbi:hypothetical protein U9M48_034518, partial [Paspalum notatum var. saurae]
MPTPVPAARQCLAPDAATALDAAAASAHRRAHAHTTSLHLISSLLAPAAAPLLRDALARARSAAYSPRLHLKALELCFAVSLDRLPSASSSADEPPVANSLMAAIKRSQANQRRNPDTFFHLYHHQPSSSTNAIKVDLSHLVLAVLDDLLVSRVFADAGFRGGDVKLAVLRPAPLLGRLPTRARPPPLFLCSFAADDDAGVPSPAAPGGDDNRRRVAEILSRGRSPMLVGVGAASAAADFAKACPYRIIPFDHHADLAVAAPTTPTSGGLILSIGDLKDLVPVAEEADHQHQEKGRRVVAEITRLLETHSRPAAGQSSVWVMGWSATYETYLAFLSKFPLVDKDWDLQLMPISTAVRDAGVMPPATTVAPLSRPATTSSMESFVPFGGFMCDAYEANSLTANSCPQALQYQQCNDRYEQEAATIIRGSGITAEVHQEGQPSLLQDGSMMYPNNGFDAVKVTDDQMVISNAKSISSPSVSQQKNADPVLNLPVRQSKSDKLLQDRALHSNSSNYDSREDHASASSAVPVATDLVLCTPHGSSSKDSGAALCKHVEDAERSIQLMPKKVDDLNLEPPQVSVQSYSFSRSYSNWGQMSPSTLHSAASGGGSAFGQWQRPSPLVAQCFDLSNYKLLMESLFKAVGRQEEALSSICESIAQYRSMERRRGASRKNDIWFSFYGPDSMAKRRVGMALAEVMHGSSENLIYLDLSLQDWGNSNLRGKHVTDYIVDELRKKQRSVIFLDNIEKADCLVQESLTHAIETGRYKGLHGGRVADLNDSIVVLSTRMVQGCKDLGMEEGCAFSEAKVMAAHTHQLKILVEPCASNIDGGPGGKAVVSLSHSLANTQASSSSSSIRKRKLHTSGEEMRPVRAWVEQVFGRSLEQLKVRCKNVSSSTLRLVACEDEAPVKD